MNRVIAVVQAELEQPVAPAVREFAARLATSGSVAAVLFYGSALRNGELDGLLDFYILVDRLDLWHHSRAAALANRLLPPNVFYEEIVIGDGQRLRAKVAVLDLQQFERGVRPAALDTTLWARFAQPTAVAWSRDPPTLQRTSAAVAQAVVTASGWAAALGPVEAPALAYWEALFRRTYAAELRVEHPDRARSITGFGSERYETLLPLAWESLGLEFARLGAKVLRPALSQRSRSTQLRRFALRQALGKPLNVARLAKAAFTFDGGADYLAWKVERHSGVRLELSDWQRRHPLLAAPAVLLRLRRAGVL